MTNFEFDIYKEIYFPKTEEGDNPEFFLDIQTNPQKDVVAVIISMTSYRVVFVVDVDGNVLAKSEIKKEVFFEKLWWNPDGEKIACIYFETDDKKKHGVMIFDENLVEINRFTYNTRIPQTLAWSPDGKRIAIGTHDMKVAFSNPEKKPIIKIYEVETRKLVKKIHDAFAQCIVDVDWKKNRLIAGGDKKIVMWETDEWDTLDTFSNKNKNIIKMSVSPNGKYAAIITLVRPVMEFPYNVVSIKDLNTGETLQELDLDKKIKTKSYVKMSWSPDNKQICFTRTDEKCLRVWDIQFGEVSPCLSITDRKILTAPPRVSTNWSPRLLPPAGATPPSWVKVEENEEVRQTLSAVSWVGNGKYVYCGLDRLVYPETRELEIMVLKKTGGLLTLKMISKRTEGKDYKFSVDAKEGETIEETRVRSGVMGKALRELGKEIGSYIRKTKRGGKSKRITKKIRQGKKRGCYQ